MDWVTVNIDLKLVVYLYIYTPQMINLFFNKTTNIRSVKINRDRIRLIKVSLLYQLKRKQFLISFCLLSNDFLDRWIWTHTLKCMCAYLVIGNRSELCATRKKICEIKKIEKITNSIKWQNKRNHEIKHAINDFAIKYRIWLP